MLSLQSFLRQGVSLGYVGLNQNRKDLKDPKIVSLFQEHGAGAGEERPDDGLGAIGIPPEPPTAQEHGLTFHERLDMILRLQSQDLNSQGLNALPSTSREAGQMPHGDSVDSERHGSSGAQPGAQRVLAGSGVVEALGHTHIAGASGQTNDNGSKSPLTTLAVTSLQGGRGSVEGSLPRTDLGGGAGRRAPAAGRGPGKP